MRCEHPLGSHLIIKRVLDQRVLRTATGCQVCTLHQKLRYSLCLHEQTPLIKCCPYQISCVSYAIVSVGSLGSLSDRYWAERFLNCEQVADTCPHLPAIWWVRLERKLPYPSRGAAWRGPPAVVATVCVARTSRTRWLVCARGCRQWVLSTSQGPPNIWHQDLDGTTSLSDAGLPSEQASGNPRQQQASRQISRDVPWVRKLIPTAIGARLGRQNSRVGAGLTPPFQWEEQLFGQPVCS